MNKPTKSLVKRPPLRNPGDSLNEEFNKQFLDRVVLWLVVPLGGFCLAFYEWMRWLFHLPVQPLTLTFLFLFSVGLSVYMIRRAWGKLRQLRLGLEGERYVGHFLQNSLLRSGYWVIHDIEGNGFNIDHTVIGPTGVFSVETKARTKPNGEAKVTFDGEKLLVAGYVPDRDPVNQAKAASKSLAAILRDQGIPSVQVQPVVLFPEWFVEAPLDSGVWVHNEKFFVKRLETLPVRLSDKEVFALAAALGRYVRDRQEKK